MLSKTQANAADTTELAVVSLSSDKPGCGLLVKNSTVDEQMLVRVRLLGCFHSVNHIKLNACYLAKVKKRHFVLFCPPAGD